MLLYLLSENSAIQRGVPATKHHESSVGAGTTLASLKYIRQMQVETVRSVCVDQPYFCLITRSGPLQPPLWCKGRRSEGVLEAELLTTSMSSSVTEEWRGAPIYGTSAGANKGSAKYKKGVLVYAMIATFSKAFITLYNAHTSAS